ncbi:MAG: HNH endonuclease [Actinomycetota bacterium]|nr:HNH endonuclease [Actinomycetota bacterium]
MVIDSETGRPIAVDDKTSPVASDPQAAREQILGMLGPEVITDTAEPQHDPSARLSRLIDLRDVRCAGPGCGSTRTHRDHHVPYPDGPTAAWNLGLLSERCHAAKHHGWTLVRHPDGSTTWTSPLGRSYHRPSPHRRPPRISRDTEPPPLRPPPKGEVPRWVTAAEPAPPVPPQDEGEAGPTPEPPDEPPF